MIEARKVPDSYWLLWWKVGWHMAFKNFAQVFLVMVVLSVMNLVLGVIPWIGSLLSAALTILLSAGAWLMAADWYRGKTPRFETLFIAFNQSDLRRRLLPLVAINILAALISGFFLGVGLSFGADLMFTLIPLLLILAVQILLLAFAVPLITLKNMDLADTIQPSYQACVKNWWPLLLNSLFLVFMLILACIPLALGLIVVVPVLICMSYVIYTTILDGADLEEAYRRFTSPAPPSNPPSSFPGV